MIEKYETAKNCSSCASATSATCACIRGLCSLFADLGYVPCLFTIVAYSIDSPPSIHLHKCSCFTMFARRKHLLHISFIVSSIILVLINLVDLLLSFTNFFFCTEKTPSVNLSDLSHHLLLCLKRTH